MAIGNWLFAIGNWLFAIGNWLFASGYGYSYCLWLLVIGYGYITTVIDYMDRVTFGP